MAQQTTTLVDDLDDTMTAEETVSFRRRRHEIRDRPQRRERRRPACRPRDLGRSRPPHRRARSPLPISTRGTAATPNRPGGRTPGGNRGHTAAVRDWARSNGYDVSARGRIPTAVQEAFDAAH